ESHQDFK
ncbi:hypothetical protein CLOM_g16376, partial [Closterium sp. NIES-68]